MCAKRKGLSKRKTKKLITLALVLIIAGITAIYEHLVPAVAAVPMGEGSFAELRILDVGQGSSALLLSREGDAGHAVLIDGGETTAADALQEELKAAGVDELELVILTHPHSDHFGGLTEVLKKQEVKSLIAPVVPADIKPTNSSYESFLDALEQNGCEYEELDEPRDYSFGEVSLKILDGFVEEAGDLNDTSLCIRIDAGEASFLITGDGETAVEDKLRLSREPVDVDILVAGHHGSNTSSKQHFLNAVSPNASAVSCGVNNRYNLPSEKAIKRLAQFGEIYRTDLSGTIIFATQGSEVTVTADNINDIIDCRGN